MPTCLSRRWRVIAGPFVLAAPVLATAVLAVAVLAAAGLGGPSALASAPAARSATQAKPASATIGAVIKPGGESVRALAVDPRTHTIWAGITTTGKSDVVAKISETSRRVLARFDVPHGVQAIAVDPVAGTVWVTSSARLLVTEIVERSSIVHTVSLAKADVGVDGLAVDPQTGLVFVLTADGLVVRISETSRVARVIAITPNEVSQGGAIGVDPGRGEVWTAGFSISTNSTQVLGFTETGTQLAGPITLGFSPVLAMTVDPVAGQVWVSDTSSHPELTEIDEASAAVDAGPFTSFKLPIGLAADPQAGAVWVADFPASTVTGVTEGDGRAGIGAPVPVGSFALSVAADPTNGRVYVGGYQLGNARNVGTVTAFTPAAPAFTSPSATWFAAGGTRAETFRVTTSGFPAPTFTVAGALPSWLTFKASTGVLTMTPGPGARPGKTVKIKITAMNDSAAAKTQTLTVHVGSVPVMTSPARLTLRAGKPVRFTIKATGVPAPVLTVGKGLPGGLRVKATGRGRSVLGGVPFRVDAGHAYRVTITATSPVGKPVTQTLTIKVRSVAAASASAAAAAAASRSLAAGRCRSGSRPTRSRSAVRCPRSASTRVPAWSGPSPPAAGARTR